jgi:hypothetical protein
MPSQAWKLKKCAERYACVKLVIYILLSCHGFYFFDLFCQNENSIYTLNGELVIRSVQIEESGGTAISFAADVSCEADVESMMRAVS